MEPGNGAFAEAGVNAALVKLLIAEHERSTRPRLERLWRYYRNASEAASGASSCGLRPRLAQEEGLPPRLQARRRDAANDDRAARNREVVIENDIAWRIQTMVDFMFGKPVSIVSTAADEETRRQVERVLDAVWEASGGIALLQDMALLGHVYGHVDLLLRVDEAQGERALLSEPASHLRLPPAPAAVCRVEVVEPTRGVPLMNPGDYRELDAYIIRVERELNEIERRPAASSWFGLGSGERRRRSWRTEVLTPAGRHIYEDDRLVASFGSHLTGGAVPVVHIQNISQPFRYEGMSEVEPLIPLQNELNTRLSDRAARVTMQSFKMYLAKGLDGFEKVPVGPGQIISTTNPDAQIEAFGGDGHSPSEEQHILELREAMDKTSGVPPLASGVVRAKIGNLSSANALRITLMGVISKTARKRVTYGGGVARMCRLILTALDGAGILRTSPEDRGVRLVWPDPLPEDLHAQALAAKTKAELGVDPARLLAELGYSNADAGIQ